MIMARAFVVVLCPLLSFIFIAGMGNGEWGMGNGARGHVLEVSNVSGEIAGNLPHHVEGEPGTTRPRRIPQPIMLQRDHPASFQKVVLELRLFGRNVSAVTMWFAGVARKSVGVAPRHASIDISRPCQDTPHPTPFPQSTTSPPPSSTGFGHLVIPRQGWLWQRHHPLGGVKAPDHQSAHARTMSTTEPTLLSTA